MEFVVDWNSVCLVCLQEGDMRSVHEKDHIGILLSEKILKCSNVEISGANFPEQICIACEADLEAAYRFITNCESSNEILKSLLETKNRKQTDDKSNMEQFLNFSTVKQKPEDTFAINVDDSYCNENIEIFKDNRMPLSKPNVKSNECEKKISPKTYIISVNKGAGDSILKCKFPNVTNIKEQKVMNRSEPMRPKKMKKTHNIKPLKICEICGNSYKYQNALENHMRRHRNEKPFSCEFCQRSFVANVELRRHMRVHTGQKPYKCHFCPRAFSDFGSRGKHERTHTGERPYTCETCGKTFAYAHVLSVHVLTHTGEKKYKCTICDKGFTKKSYLLGHTNNNHKLSS